MTRKINVILVIMILVFSYPFIAFAADAQYRLMHNDQDLLVIGQIKEMNTENLLISVNHIIISENNMSYEPYSLNERPKEVRVLNDFDYRGYSKINLQYDRYDIKKPEVNDYILISLNEESKDLFKCVWGAYKVSSTDYKNLKVEHDNDINDQIKADLAAIEYFINSNGKYSDFAFSDNKAYLKKSDNELIPIYPKEIVTIDAQQTLSRREKKDINSKATNKSNTSQYLIYIAMAAASVTIIATVARKNKVKK